MFGEKALGKSIISFQSACAAAASGMSAVILDTEQSYASYLIPYWQERMSKRFGKEIRIDEVKLERTPKVAGRKKAVTRGQVISAFSNTLDQLGVYYSDWHLSSLADVISPQLHVEIPKNEGPAVKILQLPEVIDLLSLHGIDARKQVSEGGRVDLKLQSTPVFRSVLHQIITQMNAKLLVYDSISAPFKASFPNSQDLPARSAGMAMLLAHSQRLCVEFGIAVVVISHASVDPTRAEDRRPYGGIILGHEAKFSFELTEGPAKRDEEAEAINPEDERKGARAFWVARHPAIEEYSKFGFAPIDEEGFH